ncbi:MAG: hypothetical protein HY377_02220 [Candidatus Blackburnbacteria bacterium]|nr:hypothetical protein [Candidatus Blackburnbacteria bacterium]
MAISEQELRFVPDLGCRYLEERDASIRDRITVTCLTKTPEGLLVDPETGTPLKEMLSLFTGVDQAEDNANTKIEEKVGLSENIVLWWSPPHPLRSKESRINLFVTYEGGELEEVLPQATRALVNKERALQRIRENKRLILLFALPSKHQAEECLRIAPQIAALNPQNPAIRSAEDLRNNPLLIPAATQYWVNVASEFIKFEDPEVWERIKNGVVFAMREATNKLSIKFAQKHSILIREVQTRPSLRNLLEYKIRKYAEEMDIRLKQANKSCPTGLIAFDLYHNLATLSLLFLVGENSQKITWTQGVCSICHKNTLVGDCKFCESCAKKL